MKSDKESLRSLKNYERELKILSGKSLKSAQVSPAETEH
jgi:hypothetical protein